MVFGNDLTEVSTSGWGLDDLVVARVRAAAPGATVRKITAAKDAFAAIKRPEGLSGLFHDTNADLIAAVRQIVSGTRCNRYVLVRRYGSQFSNTNQDVRGIGIVSWVGRTYLFALTYIRVFDGEDFSIIKRGPASTDDESTISRALMLNPIRGPSRKLEEGYFPATPADAASNPALRDDVRALLAASLNQTMPAMLAEQR
jgi:hypothetical protein